jgi:hypothetical protein
MTNTEGCCGKSVGGHPHKDKNMGCHYCDSWAGRPLGDKVVCEDCYQTVKAVPDEDRVGALTERLQKVHGLLIKHIQQGYVVDWTRELARRVEFLSRLSSEPGLPAPTAQNEMPVQRPTAEVQAAKLPKPLKIRKLR